MDLPVDMLSKLDVMNLLAIAAMLWFFNSRLDRKFDKVDSKIDEVKNDIGQKIDRLEERTIDIDRRLCRLEGAFTSKECCRIQDERQMKKAE